MQKQDIVSGMGGNKDYESLLLAAVVHDMRMMHE